MKENTQKKNLNIFGWIVLGLLLLIALGSWFTVLVVRGIAGISAWYLMQYASYFGAIAFVIALVILVINFIRKKKISAVLIAILVVALVVALPIGLMEGWFQMPYPASLEGTSPSLTIRLPAEEPMLVAWGGDTLATNYHVATPDQRWAYDLLAQPAFSGSANLEDYGCYGMTVVAPISAVVHVAVDGLPDEVPGVVSNNSTNPEGNHVWLYIPETQTYLLIAHLKPGSLTVKTGDEVAEGQVIGQCGNSGNTSEPHIHIHHQRHDPLQYPLGFAEGLPLYFRDIDGEAMPTGGFAVENGELVILGDTISPKPSD